MAQLIVGSFALVLLFQICFYSYVVIKDCGGFYGFLEMLFNKTSFKVLGFIVLYFVAAYYLGDFILNF